MGVEDDYPLPSQLIKGVKRTNISKQLEDLGLFKDAENFANCGKYVNKYDADCCGRELLAPKAISCGMRICPDCGNARTWEYLSRLVPLLEELGKERESEGLNFRYFEMGLPRQKYFTSADIDAITKYFTRFRKSDLWQKQVVDVGGGGLYNIENKFGFKGDRTRSGYVLKETGWNIHIHVFVLSKYLPNTREKPLLSKIWRYSTNYKASICDYPKKVPNDEWNIKRKAYEVVKYHFKSTDMRTAENYAFSHDIWKNKRQVRRFGVFRKLKMGRPKNKKHACCPVCDVSVFKTGVLDHDDVKDRYEDYGSDKRFIDNYSGEGVPLKVKWASEE